MRPSSEDTAQAAAVLVTLLSSGRTARLANRNLAIAVDARNQLLVGARGMLATLSDRPPLAREQARLQETLGHEHVTNLSGASPTDLALQPPTDPDAQAWHRATLHLDVAARALGHGPPQGRPTKMLMAADVAALVLAVALLDDPLTVALVRDGGYPHELHAIRGTQDRSLVRIAQSVMREAAQHPLATSWDLPRPADRPLTVPNLHAIAAALERATALARASEPLTNRQLAAVTTQLRRLGETVSYAALDQYELRQPLAGFIAEMLTAHAGWIQMRIHPTAPPWQPLHLQLQLIDDQLDGHRQGWHRTRPTGQELDDLTAAARWLPAVAAEVAGNVELALNAGRYRQLRTLQPVEHDANVQEAAAVMVRAAAVLREAIGPPGATASRHRWADHPPAHIAVSASVPRTSRPHRFPPPPPPALRGSSPSR